VITLAGFVFEPKLTLDGIMTLAAGVIAYVAAVRQMRLADRGLKQQLQAEKKGRLQEDEERQRAVAVAMLFELDNFYRAYVRGLAKEIPGSPKEANGPAHLESLLLPPLRKIPSDPFPMYKANGSSVGKLPPNLTAVVVHAYSAAQWVLDRVIDYQLARKGSLERGNAGPYFAFARRSLEEMRDIYSGAEITLGEAMRALCSFGEIPFQAPLIAIAELERT
jgi:hypothetical protein